MALTPEQLAEIQRLKALMQQPATDAQRKAQAVWNAEQMANKKADGGSMSVDAMRLELMNKKPKHFAQGGSEPRNWAPGHEKRLQNALRQVMFREPALVKGVDTAGEMLEHIKKTTGPENMDEQLAQDIQRLEKRHAINQWLERNFGNYVKKQMATETDPVRLQAELNVRGFPVAADPGYWARKGETRRKISGGKQMGESDVAKHWENKTDAMIEAEKAGEHHDMMHLAPGMYSEKDEWIKKLDPETKLWSLTEHFDPRDLGIDHIRDVLHEDLVNGRIRPEQLNKISMAQAVKRAHDYDEEMEKRRQETAIKTTNEMPTVHEYPESGMKWIELAMPKELPEGWSQMEGHPGIYVDPEGKNTIEHPGKKKLEEALKYEGDTMGHCVGGHGYCERVKRGEARIFSLRDAKGEPHVTIETQPHANYEEAARILETEDPTSGDIARLVAEGRLPSEQRIVQIKGKGNRKPAAKYIPHVQHFVKSGDWSHIGDYENTDLVQINKGQHATKEEVEALGRYHYPEHNMPAENVLMHYDRMRGMPEMQNEATKNFIADMEAGNYRMPPPVINKAQGGTVQPSLEQMKLAIMKQAKPDFHDLRSVGVNEAPGLDIKAFIPPSRYGQGPFPTGGVSMAGQPLPVGGVDMSGQQGNQLMPANMAQPAPQGQPGQPSQGMPSPLGVAGNTPPPQGGSNILQMTPQGQAMAAMKPTGMAMGGGVDQSVGTDHSPSVPQMVQGGITHLDLDDTQQLAKGGLAKKSVDQMKQELAEKDEEEEKAPSKRITIKADGPGGVTGIVVPHHMLHGRSWISKKTGKKVVVPGMMDINKARAEVYGSENRPPLSIGQIGKTHKKALEEHFAKPLKEQLAAEKEATAKLRAAKHLGEKANTLDKSEKLDTVNHEEDDKGRNYIGFASKGVAGHALYTSGHGKNMKHHVINTCPGQTVGCGGGTDEHGVVDTSKGTCFAPNAESQYVHAAVRRATHEQAKHDPAMTKDWILAHTGSMRQAAETGDKKNKVLLFRPNVVDETDVSSRHVIRHLNKQRKAADKPAIVANSYGKTNELHDPENGYHVTYSNVGPKVKKGESIAENIARDRQRVRSTVHATDAGGNDIKNEEGNKTPPKNSYMVTDVKRGSPMAKKMEGAITHAKYWSSGREEHELSAAEKEEGPEGHFGGNGKPTTEDKAHYGHRTHDGLRFDYQRQHILHPRLVQVGKNKDGSAHMIPTDSRFKDEEFLPKNRFKTKNGKNAGAILMTTPTESTSNIGHDTSFTHHVSDKHVEHALKNNGEYEIDKPEDQLKAKGKEYVEPRPITIRRAEGGSINVSDERGDDDFHAFPERNAHAQRHMTMRHDPEEADEIGHLPFMGKNKPVSVAPKKVKFHTDMDTINLELSNKRTKVK